MAGYAVATGVLVRVRAVLRERRRAWFLALEAATATVAVALAQRGRLTGALVNAVFVVGFAAVWWWTGRRPQVARPARRCSG